jgi:hypothetical protein
LLQERTFAAPSMGSIMLEPVAQSETKASLFKRLELDERNTGHRRLYNMMKVGALGTRSISQLTVKRRTKRAKDGRDLR